MIFRPNHLQPSSGNRFGLKMLNLQTINANCENLRKFISSADYFHTKSENNHKILINFKNKIDGIELLKAIKNDAIKVVFFDPQYRGILDKMKYGNEGVSRGKNRSDLPQMSFEIIENFLIEIQRVLKPSGYLFLWVDKFHLVDGIKTWFEKTPLLESVDMITWNKETMGMGYRTRRTCEYLVIIQKKPKLAKSTWKIHNIRDNWSEKVSKSHPHSKPLELQKLLIQATTEIDDLVCDPAAGGYSVLKACEETNRNFIGGDIRFGEKL